MDENSNQDSQVSQNSSSGPNTTVMVVGVVAVLLAALGVGGYFMMKQTTPLNGETASKVEIEEQVPTPTSETTSAGMEAEFVNVDMEAGAFYYKPNVINAKVGDKVKIAFKSVDMMHDFVIDELKVKMPVVKSGNTGTVEFTVSKAGTFEYYCSVGQHRAKGQVGKLIVQ